MEGFHLREKITHFDHERIPERPCTPGTPPRTASFAPTARVPRSRGRPSCRTAPRRRCSCGFHGPWIPRIGGHGPRRARLRDQVLHLPRATFDLVGNNMPAFLPGRQQVSRHHPRRQTASRPGDPAGADRPRHPLGLRVLHTEATHHVMWAMSDRGIPRSFRTMEGVGVHTFRLVNAAGVTALVKFHWKPVAGVHSLVWEEVQLAAGVDPDFQRRDLADAIESGAFPNIVAAATSMSRGQMLSTPRCRPGVGAMTGRRPGTGISAPNRARERPSIRRSRRRWPGRRQRPRPGRGAEPPTRGRA
jgi:catalase